MKNSVRQTLKKLDRQIEIEKALRKLREESFRYYELAISCQNTSEELLKQNRRLLEENNELKKVLTDRK